ncbi:MAG: hypothetical protein JWP31_2177, partial [Aeromicrobium sp.]|nr:hypothetical protein [Aeromicrobium sp.]
MAKRGTHARQQWPLAVLGIFVITGFLFVSASVSAGGDDLRPAGGDVASLLRERAERIDDRRTVAADLRADIDTLSASVSGTTLDSLRAKAKKLDAPTGL